MLEPLNHDESMSRVNNLQTKKPEQNKDAGKSIAEIKKQMLAE